MRLSRSWLTPTLQPTLDRTEPVEAPANWRLSTRMPILRQLRGQRPLIILSLLLGLFTAVAGAGLMATGSYLIAAAALGAPILALGAPIALVRIFGVGRGLVRYAERLTSHRVTFTLLTDLQVWCYRRLLPLAPARLGALRSGDVLARLVNDVEELNGTYLRVYAPVIIAAVSAVVLAVAFAWMNPLFAGVLISFFLLAGVGLPLFTHLASRDAQARDVVGRATLKATLVDVFQGVTDVLAFGQGSVRHAEFAVHHLALKQARQRLARVAAWQRLLLIGLAALAVWAIVLLSAQFSASGTLPRVLVPVAALLALTALEVVQPVGEAAAHYRRSTTAAGRVHALVSAAPAVADPPQPCAPPTTFDLQFENVTFAYETGGVPALRNVSFTVPEGSRVAVVGPSGCGKSTLVNLLVRFWDPQLGSVKVGGQRVRNYALTDLRRSIGVVSQRTTIFNGTLRQNLLLARPDASDDELLTSLARAQLSDLVGASAQGLDRWVGEQGSMLSGGERQRLAIARTLLLDAPVLVLDEPTANLDPTTERALLQAFAALMAGRTTLLLTHRLVNLDQMDSILVFDGGVLVEQGTHARLLAQQGVYARMFAVQEEMLTLE